MAEAPKMPPIHETPTAADYEAHQKVQRHFEHVKALMCKHTNGINFGMGQEVTCADCDEPMIFKSVVQVREALMHAFRIGRAWDAQGGDPDLNPYVNFDPRNL